MNIGVVIARYNEDVNWALSIKPKIYLYNKGPANIPMESILLPNVGREAHTYLYHVVSNYENLDDYTVFLQGNPADHGFYDTFETVENFNNTNFVEGFFPFFRKCDNFTYLTCPGNDHHHLVDLAKYHNVTLPIQDSYEFVQGAQFAVKKENILMRPKTVYEKLLHTSATSTDQFAHTMERMWKYLFSG